MAQVTATADDVGAVDDGALDGEGALPVEDDFADSAAAEWARAAFDEVTAVCPLARAKELSCGERDSLALSDGTLAYGEIVFDPFAATIAKIKARYGGLAARGGPWGATLALLARRWQRSAQPWPPGASRAWRQPALP